MASPDQIQRPTFTPDVVDRFRRGDERAFLAVYDAHAAELRPLVARFFRWPFEREEAAQEIWLHVHRMASAFDPARGELGPWLRTLAANRCKEILRAKGRRPNATVEIGDEDLVTAETPESLTRQERLRAAVVAFVARLGREEAAVFQLSLVEERGHDEVAVLVGISARRCKYLRMKLLERAATAPELRQALGDLLEP